MISLDIHTKNVELNAPLRAFIEEKMGDLENFLELLGPVHAHVEVGIPSQHHHKGQIYYAEANVNINGTLLRAESTNYDLHTAIVDVKDELKIQIKKFKEKARDKERQSAEE